MKQRKDYPIADPFTWCCDGSAATVAELATGAKPPRNTKYIAFTALSPERQQAFADYLLKEKVRHEDDIRNIDGWLRDIFRITKIEPMMVYVNKWIEVK